MDLHRDFGKAWLQLGEADKALEQFRIVAKAEPEDDTRSRGFEFRVAIA